MNLQFIIQLFVGLIMSIMYPKILEFKLKSWKIYIAVTVLVILGSFSGVIFLLLWFIILFVLINRFAKKEYEFIKLSGTVFVIFFSSLLVKYKLINFIFIPTIILILSTVWLSEENIFSEYKNTLMIIFGGLMFVNLISLIVSASFSM